MKHSKMASSIWSKLLTTSRRLYISNASYSHSAGIRYPVKLDSVFANHTAVYEESIKNPETFWGELAKERLRWMKPFDRVMNCDMKEAKMSWFEGGQLNVSGKVSSMKHLLLMI